MPSAKNNNLKLNKTLEHIMKERFVHSLSHIIYDKVSMLYHIDKESEELMSQIASKVVAGMFCLEYLSHIHSLIKEKAGLKEDITAVDLSDEGFIADLKTRLSNKGTAAPFKKAARLLKKFLDSIDIKTLDDLTKVAHTGDYLLSSLQDMKDSGHDEYNLWLSSIPYYYEKDLRHLGLMKTRLDSFADEHIPDNYTASFWNGQFPVESFHQEKIYSNHRINLNAHLPSETTEKGFFPCVRSRGRNKGIYSKARS
ncbi:MAG: hypothetical protein HY026_08250 [Deltaproteobacteria bacterium]|nr:hypothetical protein [Deltaproteobacteria bacterium]